MEEVFKNFESYLYLAGKSQTTAREYKKCLRILFQGCDYPLVRTKLIEFLNTLYRSGKKGKYLNNLICVARAYGKSISTADFENLGHFKQTPVFKETMTNDEIEAFLNLPPTTGCKETAYLRWKVFFSILCYCGLRAGECACLRTDDIKANTSGRLEIHVKQSKTPTGVRCIEIPEAIHSMVAGYIAGKQGFVFGTPMHSAEWSFEFQKRVKKLGIARRGLSCHSLRHSIISRLVQEDVSLPTIMKFAGHNKPESTLVYTHLCNKDVTNALKKDPLNRKHLTAKDKLRIITNVLNDLVKNYAGVGINFEINSDENSITFRVKENPVA